MKKNRSIWIGTVIAVVVFIVTANITTNPPLPPSAVPSAKPAASPTAAPPPKAPAPAPAPAATAQTPSPTPANPVAATPDDPPPPPSGGLPPPTLENARQAIEDLDLVIRDFRNALGGNPVGDNAEITRALRGENLKQLKLRLPGNSPLNASGELCDIWGTPYFFHQLSGKQMEIRSAGPDRKMWTPDDIRR